MASGSPSAVRRARRLGRSLRLAIAAALGLGLIPAAALASSVELQPPPPATPSVLEYLADAGETNALLIVPDGTGNLQVVDPGAVAGITTGPGCFPVTPGVAQCADTTVASMDVDLGDGGDSAKIQGLLPTTLAGGSGDDVLTGGSGTDDVFGDDGADELDGAIAADVLHGGSGADLALYRSRDNSVKVTLDGVANDGEAGEGDNVMPDVENVDGGGGDDWLVGSTAGNALRGKAGADVLQGGFGADALDGGDGNDVMLSGGDGGDLVACGAGDDEVYADGVDAVAADCEHVHRTGAFPTPPSPAQPTPPTVPQPVVFITQTRNGTVTATRSGAVPVGLVCFAPRGKACRGTISLELTIHVPVGTRPSARATAARHKRRRVNLRLARSRFSVGAGRTKRVPLALIASARRRLDSCRRLQVRIVIASHDARGESKTVTRRATIVRAKGRRTPKHRYICS
jgi:hypothetical protein